jgi:CII-binding regulator of phage lambda lysogenization HflD
MPLLATINRRVQSSKNSWLTNNKIGDIDVFVEKWISAFCSLECFDLFDTIMEGLLQHLANMGENFSIYGGKIHHLNNLMDLLRSIHNQNKFSPSISMKRLLSSFANIVANSVETINLEDQQENAVFLSFLYKISDWGLNLDWTEDHTRRLINAMISLFEKIISKGLNETEVSHGRKLIIAMEDGLRLGRCPIVV